jgi:RNA polymerase sigma factor (sigma-70 family)
MSDRERDSRLSAISTRWDLLIEAHGGRSNARALLLRRYCGAVYSYFKKAVRDPDVAGDLSQEFALRFLRGDFRRADPQRGRFRDLIQKALYHMVIDHHRRARRQPMPLAVDGSAEPAVMPQVEELDAEFVRHWRGELLERTWEALAEAQATGDHRYYDVLKWRAENPETPSARLAERLTTDQCRPFTEAGVRQILHRARVKFAELLLEEVARSIGDAAPELIQTELIDLGLLPYCQPALERRARSSSPNSL